VNTPASSSLSAFESLILETLTSGESPNENNSDESDGDKIEDEDEESDTTLIPQPREKNKELFAV